MIRPKCYGLEQKSPSLTKDWPVRLAETWLKNTVLAEMLWEKNTVPTEKEVEQTEYGVSRMGPSVLFPWKSRCCDKYLGGRSKFTLFLKQYNDTNTYIYIYTATQCSHLSGNVRNNTNILYFEIGLYYFLKNVAFQTCVRCCLPTVVLLFTNWPYKRIDVLPTANMKNKPLLATKLSFICCIN